MPTLDQIVGQEQLVSRLREFASHFRLRGEAPDHILLIGPNGMGQNALGNAFAAELGAPATICYAESLEKKGDLTATLTSLDAREVLILRNAAQLRQPMIEVLIPALSEFRIDLVLGQGAGARVHAYKLNRFTCLACVEKESDISPKLRDEFALRLTLQPYSTSELSKIAGIIAQGTGRRIDESAALLIASASHGSPHQVQGLMRRITAADGQRITEPEARSYLLVLGLQVPPEASPPTALSIDQLTGFEFERLVATLLARMGFQVETTKATGDGGIDIIASFQQTFLRGRYLVQCKRFLPGSAVGAPVVREFYGAVRADPKAVKGIFITTSSFTEQAREFAEKVGIELIDREQLEKLLGGHEIVRQPPTPPRALF